MDRELAALLFVAVVFSAPIWLFGFFVVLLTDFFQ
jgi:hypothetical protein